MRAVTYEMQVGACCECCVHHHRGAEVMCEQSCGQACWGRSVQPPDHATGAEQGCQELTCCGIVQRAIPQ